MNLTTIRTLLIVLLGAIIFSCANSKSNRKDKSFEYRIIKTEILTDYKLVSFANGNDTVLVVTKNGVSEHCIKEKLVFISLQNNNKIAKLNDNGEEISFVYYSKGGENNNLKILTGSGSPGSSRKQVISYNSFPYFVERCK